MTSAKKTSYFGDSSKKDKGLFKIIIGILILGGLIVGGLKVSAWIQTKLTGHLEKSVPQRLENARDLLAADNPTQAMEEIRPILERIDNPDITPKALLLQIEIKKHQGNDQAEEAILKTLIDTYPKASEFPEAAIDYARILEEKGDLKESLALYTTVHQTAPPALRAPATTALARDKERNGNPLDAHTLYKEAIADADKGSDAWEEAVSYLGALNTKRLFSQTPTPDSKVYTVKAGDNLSAIGDKLNVTQGQLLRANGLDNPDKLRLNQTLKYTPKDFRIVIERTTCKIYLMDSEGIFKVYSTGLGRPGKETTTGRYIIGNKEKDPTWHKPGATPIPPGDPRNELGSRWLPLIPDEEALPTDLGIHGTIQPDSVGRYSSSGCPRMHNIEVEELYDLVVLSTPVQIVDVYTEVQ